MRDEDLQQWVEKLSEEYFQRPFLHQAKFNARLRSTGGRYFTTNHNIEISRLQYETHGPDEVERIIKHELCHYHLHLMKRGYRHRDQDFKNLLKSVGGSRFCQALPIPRKTVPYKYRLECVNCKTEYYRKRKMNPRRYACGKCGGKLKLFALPNNPKP